MATGRMQKHRYSNEFMIGKGQMTPEIIGPTR